MKIICWIYAENIKEENKYFEMIVSVLYGSGVNIEAERENFDNFTQLAQYSANLNYQLQGKVVQMCQNTNRGYYYTQISINCSKVGLDGFPDRKEIDKISQARLILDIADTNISQYKTELESKQQFWINIRNLMYILLIVLTGLGTAFKFYLDKKYTS